MKYDKATLRATAVDVKKAWEDSARSQHAAAEQRYTRCLKEWQANSKDATIALLRKAIKDVQQDRPTDGFYKMRDSIDRIPVPPKPLDCCTPTTNLLDALIELLDNVKDDDVSSSALTDAGFRDLRTLLRRPC